jgi:hypothetical protein
MPAAPPAVSAAVYGVVNQLSSVVSEPRSSSKRRPAQLRELGLTP